MNNTKAVDLGSLSVISALVAAGTYLAVNQDIDLLAQQSSVALGDYLLLELHQSLEPLLLYELWNLVREIGSGSARFR